MTTVASDLPITETVEPADQAALGSRLREAFAAGTAIYPVGGGTSLDYGLTPTRSGIGLSLKALNRVVDYPSRDMTITLEAGVTMGQLAETLAAEQQWLPLDVPHASEATIGGVIATAWSGPRRYGYGTPRDYVIGITAVDGRGVAFKGGGRVVKNVAGYDFCKLLTGSLGTLGVITQVTLKIKPRPAGTAFLVCDVESWQHAERLLAALVNSSTTPSAIELLAGPVWRESPTLGLATAGSQARLAVGLEGTEAEVVWMLGQLAAEWRAAGVDASHSLRGDHAQALWSELAEFSAAADAPLVLKASTLPSRITDWAAAVHEYDSAASIQAHAGNGIVIARFSKFDAADVSRALVGRLHPAAEAAGGEAIVLSTTLEGLTRQAVWGGSAAANRWMHAVKQNFDPKNLLNPGRFVYENL